MKTEPEKTPEPEPKQITEDIVNDYVKHNPDTVSKYLRNERAVKAQRKQMSARSLLNNAFKFFCYFIICIIKDAV